MVSMADVKVGDKIRFADTSEEPEPRTVCFKGRTYVVVEPGANMDAAIVWQESLSFYTKVEPKFEVGKTYRIGAEDHSVLRVSEDGAVAETYVIWGSLGDTRITVIYDPKLWKEVE